MAQPLRCPTCRRMINWSEQFPYRPFCSDRCRLIDLGGWLSEQRGIPDESADVPPDLRPEAPDEN